MAKKKPHIHMRCVQCGKEMDWPEDYPVLPSSWIHMDLCWDVGGITFPGPQNVFFCCQTCLEDFLEIAVRSEIETREYERGIR